MHLNGKKAPPPTPGHKCLGATMRFEVDCECGWHSNPHRGEGARAAAYSEWRDHVRDYHCSEAKRREGRADG